MTWKAPLAIIDEHGLVLALERNGRFALPEVDLEPRRPGIAISSAVRSQMNLEIFCLIVPMNSEIHVLRLQSPTKSTPSGFMWVNPADISDRQKIQPLVEAALAGTNDFGGYAWYSEINVWLKEKISRLGYTLRGLQQWNGRVGGVLLRVMTSGPDFWFKAVNAFNTRETNIAQMLAARHPKYFPRIAAVGTSWNAFLMEHVEGRDLNDCDNIATWKTVASTLAEVQMEWMNEENSLLSAGAADLRADTIATGLPEFLDHIEAVMGRQSKTSPSAMTRADLDSLGNSLYALATDVATLSVTPGLANADFSPHNTLITGSGPVFIDWAEACVSLPLIAGEYMWNRMVIESPDRAGWQSALREAYLSRWAADYGAPRIDEAARLLPAFAVLAVAIFYHERECNGPSLYDAYLRSLARRLDRETKKLTDTKTERTHVCRRSVVQAAS